MKTREGNPIYPPRGNMRQAVFGMRPESPCAGCKHLGDLCHTLDRTHATQALTGYSYVAECSGEEPVVQS